MERKSLIYCGEVNTGTTPWKFNVHEIAVTDCGILGFKAEASYFQGPQHSSYFFNERVFDELIKITDEMTLLYSKDKKACYDFVVSERKKMLDEAQSTLEKVKTAVLQYIDENNYVTEDLETEILGVKDESRTLWARSAV